MNRGLSFAVALGLFVSALPASADGTGEKIKSSAEGAASDVQRVVGRADETIRQTSHSYLGDKNELTVGVGVLAYFSGGAPGTSGAWDVRYSYAAHPLLSVEGGYLGAAGDAAGPGAMVATILEGDAKFTPLGSSKLSPYLLAGAGWGAFSAKANADNGTVVVPLGAGADYHMGDRFVTGARFTYRLVANDHVGPFRADADNWALIARVGATF